HKQCRCVIRPSLDQWPLPWTLTNGLVLSIEAQLARRLTHRDERGRAQLVAVLPFENLGRPEGDYFTDGVADQVRGKLLAVPGLRVVASGSANQYRHSAKSPAQIAQELGAQYLLY